MANIYFLGFSGVGKTTIGAVFAQELQRPFFDVDAEIVAMSGKSIREIFTAHNEAYFRRLETRALQVSSLDTNAVISTGGGVVLAEENWQIMRAAGITVALVMGFESLYLRVQQLKKAQRPLYDDITREKLAVIYQQRMPQYQQADLLLEIDNLSDEQVIAQLHADICGEG